MKPHPLPYNECLDRCIPMKTALTWVKQWQRQLVMVNTSFGRLSCRWPASVAAEEVPQTCRSHRRYSWHLLMTVFSVLSVVSVVLDPHSHYVISASIYVFSWEPPRNHGNSRSLLTAYTQCERRGRDTVAHCRAACIQYIILQSIRFVCILSLSPWWSELLSAAWCYSVLSVLFVRQDVFSYEFDFHCIRKGCMTVGRRSCVG